MTKRIAGKSLISAVGILQSCFAEKFAVPRQSGLVPSASAVLRIEKKFRPWESLKGLEGFSHVWLLSYLHLNANKTFRPAVHPPRLKGKAIGCFASRAPHRPSPIGLSLAKLEKIEGDALYLSGVDLVDGTPIIDIKPYVPRYDAVPGARSGWASGAADGGLRVVLSRPARTQLSRLEADGRKGLSRLVREALRFDPRNPRDRSQLHGLKIHEARFFDCAVSFRIRGKTATVLSVQRARSPGYLRRAPVPRGL